MDHPCQPTASEILLHHDSDLCKFEPQGANIRLLFIRNLKDEECLTICKWMINEIRTAIPHVVILAQDQDEKKKLGADIAYMGDVRLACAIVIGGDGTILYAASLFEDLESPPILGIAKGMAPILYNFGVSELADITPCFIERIKSKNIVTQTCERLQIKKRNLKTKEEVCSKRVALSEVTIHRGKNNSCVRLDIFVDDVFMTSSIGDGMIFATPYGSLAYSLASNGPILSNNTNSITMVPICPLSLSFRPLCLPNSTVVRIRLSDKSRSKGVITCDGFRSYELDFGDEIEIRMSNKKINMVCEVTSHSTQRVWINKLKNVLNWGNEFSA